MSSWWVRVRTLFLTPKEEPMTQVDVMLMGECLGSVHFPMSTNPTMEELATFVLPRLDWCDCLKKGVCRIGLTQSCEHVVRITALYDKDENKIEHLYCEEKEGDEGDGNKGKGKEN